MKRRSDRGEWSTGDMMAAGILALILWVSMTAYGLILESQHKDARSWHANAHDDLQRIIRAVCVYAPPAVPAEEVPDEVAP